MQRFTHPFFILAGNPGRESTLAMLP
jgi:hypothetical protein